MHGTSGQCSVTSDECRSAGLRSGGSEASKDACGAGAGCVWQVIGAPADGAQGQERERHRLLGLRWDAVVLDGVHGHGRHARLQVVHEGAVEDAAAARSLLIISLRRPARK